MMREVMVCAKCQCELMRLMNHIGERQYYSDRWACPSCDTVIIVTVPRVDVEFLKESR